MSIACPPTRYLVAVACDGSCSARYEPGYPARLTLAHVVSSNTA
jgi:hypothetical protein